MPFSEVISTPTTGTTSPKKGGHLGTGGVSPAGWRFVVERVLDAVDDDRGGKLRDALYENDFRRARKKVGGLRTEWQRWQSVCRLPGVTMDAQGRLSEADLPTIAAYIENEYGSKDRRWSARHFISKPFAYVSLFEELQNRRVAMSEHYQYHFDKEKKKFFKPRDSTLRQIEEQFAYLPAEDLIAVTIQIQKQRLCHAFLRADERLQEDVVRFCLRAAGRDDSVVGEDAKTEGRSQ